MVDFVKSLGFSWDRSLFEFDLPVFTVDCVCFCYKKTLPEYIWNALVLETNPLNYEDVCLILNGEELPHQKISDQDQCLNLAQASLYLISLLKQNKFEINKDTFKSLNNIIACQDALEWGVFRGEGLEWCYTPSVKLGTLGFHIPIHTKKEAAELNSVFENGLALIKTLPPIEAAMTFFLFGSLHQFFFDGNKRSSLWMLNGILMSHGIDAMSIPVNKIKEFNEKMARFYLSKNANEVVQFLIECHPDFDQRITPSNNVFEFN